MTGLNRALLCATTAIGLSFSAHAQAQSEEADDTAEDIIVTGTLIRGIAPAGSNTVAVSREDIQLSGRADSVQILNNLVPQSNNFMQVQQIANNQALGVTRTPLTRPSLRNLGDANISSGSPTLVLMDGHRIVPMGITQSTVDIGIIPPGLIERQEIVLDGTSAVYGSDAVAGTINYITRRRIEGTEVNVQAGLADNYYQVSADVTSGVKWNTGGLALSYSFAKNSDVLFADRRYAVPRNYLLATTPLTGTACDTYSTVTVGAVSVITPGLTQPAQPCATPFQYASLVSAQERHSGFLNFSQDLGERIKFDVTAFYSSRKSDQNFGPFTSASTIRPTNPYFTPIPGVASQPTQTVSYSWGPVFGNDAASVVNKLEVWQVSPMVSVDLGGDWNSRTLFSYGESRLAVDQATLDSTRVAAAIAGTTTTTALNPYNIAASPSSLFAGLVYDNHVEGQHKFTQAREVADGPLFAIAGGDVRAAIGAEWTKTDLKVQTTNATTHIVGPFNSVSQETASVFGELNVPLVSEQNSSPGLRTLTLSASARYDHYDDFGGTFNPKVAVTYEPVDWFRLRGNWGKSFRAPNVADKIANVTAIFRCVGPNVPGCTNITPGALTGQVLAPPPANNIIAVLGGVVPDLRPEKSKSWSIGADIRPPMLPGLNLSATFWNIEFKDAISLPPTLPQDAINGGAAFLVIKNPTAAQISALAGTVPNGSVVADAINGNPLNNVLYFYDQRIQNLSSRKLNGLDMSVRYSHPTSFGSIDAAFNGTWNLKNETQLVPGAPTIDQLAADFSTFRSTFALGADVGNLRGQATWQHLAGFALTPSATQCTCQTSIDGFDLFNLSFRYSVPGSAVLLKDLVLTLTVNNVLDAEPPLAKTNPQSFRNGSTIGRLFSLGIQKKF